MQNLIICLLLYFFLVLLELVPNFEKKQKKTVIFTVSILAVTLVVNIFAGFDVRIEGITDIVEKSLEFIYKI